MTPSDEHATGPGGEEETPDAAIAAMPRGPLANLRRRIALTYEYLGPREVAWRILTFPLRFTPLRHRLKVGSLAEIDQRRAASWYREKGRPVSVVIPTYGDTSHVAEAVRSIRRTTRSEMVRIVVCDDASPDPADVRALQAIEGIDTLVRGEHNAGFAANANRGLSAADPALDIVLLNADIVARKGWLECLQSAAYTIEGTGIVGGKLLYPDGRIQHAGVHRNLGAPEWFDHRFRFKPADYGPANIIAPALAVTGACMYVKREVIDAIGLLDERYPMAYEDVDWCLRAWGAGYRVVYFPAATLTHLESVTRGTSVGERELESQRAFWERWGDFFDARGSTVRTPDGRLRVVYVTEDTGVGGGHRDIFEHLNRLHARGHDVRLFTLGDEPGWFDLQVPVHTFEDYDELVETLAGQDAIKVATWWNTGTPVWTASVVRGIPVFFVQDIETSYYPDDERNRYAVLASYRQEFHYMTISGWNADRLRELGLESTLVPPGIDLENFRPLRDVQRRDDMLLALGRTNPLKNLPLTIDAWKALPSREPELCLFGIEPELGSEHGARYVSAPSDAAVNELFNEAPCSCRPRRTRASACRRSRRWRPAARSSARTRTATATSASTARTASCPEPTDAAVSGAIARLLADPQLRARLGEAGRRTARDYEWERRIDELETFLSEVAAARSQVLGDPRRLAVEDAKPEHERADDDRRAGSAAARGCRWRPPR